MYIYLFIIFLIQYPGTLLCIIHCSCISDKLTKNLIEAALEWDKKDNLNKAPSKRSNQHMEDLLEAIRSCGLSFQVWEKTNGGGSGMYDFTSLMGSAKKLLLKKLPDKLKGVIMPDTEEAVIKLWKVSLLD
jgi:hypothetical protein